MPWADKVPSIVHAWYLGNATGDAIADVLTGEVNPSGKLSMTFPKCLEDVPAHGHFNSENGVVGVFRWCSVHSTDSALGPLLGGHLRWLQALPAPQRGAALGFWVCECSK
jgi:hypothetical protein